MFRIFPPNFWPAPRRPNKYLLTALTRAPKNISPYEKRRALATTLMDLHQISPFLARLFASRVFADESKFR